MTNRQSALDEFVATIREMRAWSQQDAQKSSYMPWSVYTCVRLASRDDNHLVSPAFAAALQDRRVTLGTDGEIWQRAWKFGPANEPEARRLFDAAPENVKAYCRIKTE